MIEIIIAIISTAAAYRGAIAVAATGQPGSRRAMVGRWLGVDERRSGGSGEER